MTYSQHVYGTGAPATDNRNDDKIDGRMIALSWRLFTDPASRRNLRHNKANKAAFAWLWIDAYAERSRHRGALNMLQ